MRKTNHILHGVLTLVTVGIWSLGWGIIILRNWAYNESHGYNDLKRNGHPLTPQFVESRVRYSSFSTPILVPVDSVDSELLASVKKQALDAMPATYLPKAPTPKKKSFRDETESREFGIDEELTKMFEEMGITDPEDMQRVIDAALADDTTKSPRNRLLFSFGGYAKQLIDENDLQIPVGSGAT
jgi:hypothetical protein